MAEISFNTFTLIQNDCESGLVRATLCSVRMLNDVFVTIVIYPVNIHYICSLKNKMHVDQEVQKAQGDDQKEHADKKSETEDMEVCEHTQQRQMDLKACIYNCSLLVVHLK